MNKIYKVIWNKVKNSYIVVSELAKSRTKSSKSGVINCTLMIGVLACVLGYWDVMPAEAATMIFPANKYGNTGQIKQPTFVYPAQQRSVLSNPPTSSRKLSNNGTILYQVAFGDPQDVGSYLAGEGINTTTDGTYVIDDFTIAYDVVTGNTRYFFGEYQADDDDEGFFGWELTATEVQRLLGDTPLSSVLAAVKGGVSYGTGNGIAISSDNKISAKATNGIVVNSNGIGVKAGTGITVNSNGVSITPGSIASGNVNAITGGTAYSELRPTNGTYVKQANATGTNLKALDDAVLNRTKFISVAGSSTEGNYLGTNATGTNAVAIGADASAFGIGSIVVGKKAKATGNNAVAIGIDSVASDANVISFGHKHTDTDVSGTQYSSDLYRRLTNVAEGSNSNDAAVVSQTVQMNNGTNSVVTVTGTNTIGQHMVKIDVPGNGTVMNNNTGLISGGTLFSEVRQPSDGNYIKKVNSSAVNMQALDTQAKINADNIISERNSRIEAIHAEAEARNLADTNLSNRIGVKDDNGNYIKASSTNNVIENMDILDVQLKATNDALAQETAERQEDINAEISMRQQAINGLSDRIGIQESDGNYIKKSSTNSVAKNMAVLDSQLKVVSDGLDEEILNRTNAMQSEEQSRIAKDTELSDRIDDLSGNTVQYDSSVKAKVILGGTGGTILTNVKGGNIALNSTDAVNGGQLYQTNQRIGTLAADGQFVHSAANVSDNLMALDTGLSNLAQSVGEFDDIGVKYNDINKGTITLGGSNGTIIDNLADGLIEQGSRQAVTGSQMWDIRNLLNNEITTSADRDSRTNQRIDQLSGTLDNALLYDSTDGDIATLKGSRGTLIKNVRSGGISSTSQDAVNGSQLYQIKQDIAGFATDIRKNTANIQNLNTSVSSALSSVAVSALMVDTMDAAKADSSLNNLTESGKRIIQTYAMDAVQEYMASQGGAIPVAPMAVSNTNGTTLHITDAGNGSLHVGEGSYVNGVSSIAIGAGNQVNANNSGAFGDPSIIDADDSYVLGNDDRITSVAKGSFIVGNNSKADAEGSLLFGSNSISTGKNALALGNNTVVSAENSVAIGTGSDALEENVVSVGNATLQRKIINVANGTVAEDSHEAITGAQLFVTNEKVQSNTNAIEANKQAIDKKADIDGSNIDVNNWSTRLGTGVVEQGSTGLVNGGIVYNAIDSAVSASANQIAAKLPIQVDENDSIAIGKNNGGKFISVLNKDGEGRVISGVVTNPEDKLSATNVGYVNAMGNSIIQGVNGAMSAMDSKINKVGANAAALASLNPGSLDGDEKFGVAAAVGNYRDATAGAVGLFYKPQDNLTMNVRGSFGTDENMVGAGVYVALNKGNTPGVSKAQLVKTVNAQAERIQRLEAQVAQLIANASH